MEHLGRETYLAVAIRLSLAKWLETRDDIFLLALQQLHIMPSNPTLEIYNSSFWKIHMHMITEVTDKLNLPQQMSGGKGLESENMALTNDAGLDMAA